MNHRILKRVATLAVPLVALGMVLASAGAAQATLPAVKVTAAYFQVDGAPKPPTNPYLNKEYIVVRNMGKTTVTITGWTLRDLPRPGTAAHVYKFPAFSLAAGASVRVHTGAGTNSKTDLYWHLTYFVWGDDSDTATLKTGAGTTVSTCSWAAGEPSPKFC